MFFNPILADDIGKLLLRLVLGVVVLFHGVYKVFHPAALDWIGGMLTKLGLPMELSFAVYLGEVLGPLLVIVGMFSRIGGLLIVINMIFAMVLVDRMALLQINKFGGWQIETEVLLLVCGLAVLLGGSGKFAARPD
ncbi:MAG TPA: DoxX family protein [Burkholderiales bacterium]|nr:DoxX family protein [Burkholderiales bacterium]